MRRDREEKNTRAAQNRKSREEAIRGRAEDLIRTAHIPRAVAFQVAQGTRDLNDVLRQMAVRDRVETLVRRHDLQRSLAMQVALGQADLDEILRKNRMKEHLEQHRDRSVLLEAARSRRPVALAVHGLAVLRGVVESVGAYEFTLAVDGGPPQTLHKLQVKFAYDPDQWKSVKKGLATDAARRVAREPVALPQERYGCSDRRLFRYMDGGAVVVATTLEGDLLRGRITWMGRWEFGLNLLRGGGAVTVMRHALAEIGEDT